MSKSAASRDGITVVIPAHNAAEALDQVLPAWGAVLANLNRPYEIIVVDDGSTDTTAAVVEKRASTVQHLHLLKHDTQTGFGACLRTALAEAKQPLLLYAGVDYPYTPSDIRGMLERIELRDEILGKQPDLINGARAGQERPPLVTWAGRAWKLFWRIFAGLPMTDSPPWYGWDEWWYRLRVGWVYGVPLADVNSAFKLYRTAFLRRFPIQSDGDFVHTELVAKATFLTSIMDEVPLTPKPNPLPPLGPTAADQDKVFRKPEFTIRESKPEKPPEPSAPVAPAPAEPTAPPITNQSPAVTTETNPTASSSPLPAASTPPATAPQPSELAKTNVSPAAPIPGATVPASTAVATPAQPSEPTVGAATEPAPTPSAPAPSVAAQATSPPAAEPAKSSEPAVNAAPEPTKPEPAKPTADSDRSPDTPGQGKAVEANAGGLSSPGSPVPAT